jgi:hypothetical protein
MPDAAGGGVTTVSAEFRLWDGRSMQGFDERQRFWTFGSSPDLMAHAGVATAP